MWQAKHAILGLQYFYPQLRRKLNRPWDALKAWRASTPSSHRVPITSQLVQAMFGIGLDTAFGSSTASRGKWFCFAILLRLGFYALLRPAELCNLRRRD
eukprot:483612-Karenia_brevis.AAC.1